MLYATKRACSAALSLLLLGLLSATPLAAQIVVNTNADELNADGDCSLREAVQAANTNVAVDNCAAGNAGADTITMAALANQTVMLSLGEIAITEALSITGAAVLRPVIDANSSSRIFNVGADVSISLVDLTNGSVTGNGGAILVGGANDLTLTGVSISGSTAAGGDGNGGAIYFGSGMLTVENPGTGSTFSSNSAEGDAPGEGGGAVYIDGGTATFTAVSFQGNTADTGALGNGGALLNDGGTVTLEPNAGATTFTTFNGNLAARAGGAIENNGGTVTLDRVSATNNVAGINGGMLHTSGSGIVDLDGGTYDLNTADAEGGALWNSAGGTMTVDGATITGNTASGAASDQGGGGIFNDGGTLTVGATTAVSITGNTASGAAGSGGGLLSVGGTVSLTDVTVTGNEAIRAGGGIELIDGTFTMTNGTLSNNDVSVIGGTIVAVNPGNGGGLHVSGTANTTFDNVTVSMNRAGREGGGLWNQAGATMTIQNGSTVSSNIAEGNASDDGGGGIFNNGGTLVLDGSAASVIVTANLAIGTSGSGGGILSTAGALTITDTDITSNEAARAGGGIEMIDGTLTMTGGSLNGNDVTATLGSVASANPGNGGGFHITGTTATNSVTFDGVTINGNDAGSEGGGLWNQAGVTMTIQNGTTFDANIARGDAADNGGGAVFNNGGTLVVTGAGTTFTNNTAPGASGSGGAIFSTDGTVTITDATIGGANAASRAGGGIEVITGTVTLTGATLTGNTTGNAPGNGGGLHVSGAATVNVVGGTVTGNTADQEGGGLWNSATGTMNVTNGATISGNTATASNSINDAQGGGGIFNLGVLNVDGTMATVTITGNTSAGSGSDDGGGGIYSTGAAANATVVLADITNNDATGASGSGGGLHNNDGGMFSLDRSTVSGNSANRAGNGIEDNGGTQFTITNSTVSGNVPGAGAAAPGNGGGLHKGGTGTVGVENSTFSGNTAAAQGGGLWNSGASTMGVRASTVVMNTAPSGGGFYNVAGGVFAFDNLALGNNTAGTAGPDCFGTFISGGFSLVEDTTDCTFAPAGTDITGTDPDLGPLVDNGGPTLTHLPVFPTSPLIDAGNSTGTDQRGMPRQVDEPSTADAGNGSDIGAVESTPAELPVELISFDAARSGSAVTLTWATASETNNDGFEVQRRLSDASAFETVTFVGGAGTTLEAQTYSHQIGGLEVGTHVFRLKQLDYDGSFSYSAEIEVSVEVSGLFELSKAYPNPAKGQSSFTLAVQQAQDVTVAVYNTLGQRVTVLHSGTLETGRTHSFTLEGAGFASGLYLIRAEGETFAATRRVTLVR